MATYCFNLAAILTVSVICHALVISRDQQAKIADTQTLGKHVEWHIFIFLIFGHMAASALRQQWRMMANAKFGRQFQVLYIYTRHHGQCGRQSQTPSSAW